MHRCRTWGNEVPSRAYDGNFKTWYSSDGGADPWISFQLWAPYDDVGVVQLWARDDSDFTQVKDLTVAVSTGPGALVGTICEAGVTAKDPGQSFNISCPPTPGAQWVTVYRAGGTSAISVAEIKVFRGGCMHARVGAASVPAADHQPSELASLHSTHAVHGGYLARTPSPPAQAVHSFRMQPGLQCSASLTCYPSWPI